MEGPMQLVRFAGLGLVGLALLAVTKKPAAGSTSAAPARQFADTITQRPTDVTLIMGNSRRYAGTYQASGTARICGHGPLRDFAGFVDGFTLMFPDGEDLEIED